MQIQEARSKHALNFNRRTNDFVDDVIVVQTEKNLTQRTQGKRATEFTGKIRSKENKVCPDERGTQGRI